MQKSFFVTLSAVLDDLPDPGNGKKSIRQFRRPPRVKSRGSLVSAARLAADASFV
jgi:hypothetical protein